MSVFLQFPGVATPNPPTAAADGLQRARDLLAAAMAPEQVASLAPAEALALAAWPRIEARVLAAQLFDRRRWLQGQPQKFGTLAVRVAEGWRLWPVAPGTTDSERAKWGLPTLQELEQQVRMVPA